MANISTNVFNNFCYQKYINQIKLLVIKCIISTTMPVALYKVLYGIQAGE